MRRMASTSKPSSFVTTGKSARGAPISLARKDSAKTASKPLRHPVWPEAISREEVEKSVVTMEVISPGIRTRRLAASTIW